MILTVGVSALALLWPLSAYAQLTAPVAGAPIEFGPLSIYPTMNLVDVGTDSNVFDDGAEPKKDFTFTLQSRVTTVLKGGTNRLMFLTGNDLVWFRQYKQERSSNGQYGLRADLALGRFKPFLEAGRTKTRARPNREIDARARRTVRNAGAGIDYVISPVTAITAGVTFDDSNFDTGESFRSVDLARALGRTGRVIRGGLKFSLTPFTTLSVLADIGQDRFSGSHLRDSDSLQVAPSLDFTPDAALSGRISAGYRRFKPQDPTQAEYRGLVVSTGVTYSLLGMTTFDVQLNRDVSYSYLDTEAYYVQTGGLVGIVQRIGGPFDLKVAVGRDRLVYRWHDGDPVGSAPRGDTENTVSGGIQIRLGGTRLGFVAERTLRRSTLANERDFSRTRFLGSVTAGS